MYATPTTPDQAAPPATALPVDFPPPPPPHPVQWWRAVQALRTLLANPQETEKALEVFLALSGDEEERMFQRLLADPQGRRLALAQPCLLSRLANRAELATLPDGSFGRAYLAYLDRTGLDPVGLVRLKEEMEVHARAIGEELPVLDPAREWFRVRGILTHDLWHVLTDYDTDELGEAALLAFSLAQLPGRAGRLLTAGATCKGARALGPGFLRYEYQAWRRGRRAAWLPALPYEDLLGEPLEAVRARARITPGAVAHPGGILRGAVA